MRRTTAARRRRLSSAVAAAALGMGLVSLAPPAAAAPGPIVLASTSTTGATSNGTSSDPALSSGGTRVAFRSDATNLHPNDQDRIIDVYVKDLLTGRLVLASTSAAGVKGNGESFRPVVSASGIRVAFASTATNLHPGDTTRDTDVYVKDVVSGDIALASTSAIGAKSNQGSLRPALSADGTRVAFYSTSTNLHPGDTEADPDVYVKDLRTGNIVLASTTAAGVKGNGDSYDPVLSADGTRVAFWSFATNLDPSDTDRFPDAYVKDLRTGRVALVSTSDTGAKGNAGSYFPALSADGTTVAFFSSATNLDPADTDTDTDIYVKDLRTGELLLASTSDTGRTSNGNSFLPVLSPDGSRVTFYSGATNLDPADTDNGADVYVKDLPTGELLLASTSEAGVKGNGNSNAPVLSTNGTVVAFISAATNLVPADDDALPDVYVKRLAPSA